MSGRQEPHHDQRFERFTAGAALDRRLERVLGLDVVDLLRFGQLHLKPSSEQRLPA